MARNRDQNESDVGYGASEQGDLDRATVQEQLELRDPPTDEETDLDDYAQNEGYA